MNQIKIKNRGITLIALIVTIIILLILIQVTFRVVLGEEGIIAKAKWAEYVTEYESVDEAKVLYRAEQMMKKYETSHIKKVENEYKIASLETVNKLEQIMYPVTEKINIEEMPATLKTTIIKIENLAEEDLTNEEKVNLYKVDFSKIKVDVKREYTINIVTGMLYSIDSEVYKGNIYHTPRLGITKNGDIVDQEGEVMNQPGTYKMTVNAGEVAQWLGIEVKNLSVPDGARVEYSFETSDDRANYDEAVSNIDDARNSQFLRVKITLIANEKGECPSLTGIKVKFKTKDNIVTQEPVLENMEKTEDTRQPMYGLQDETTPGKISQIIDFGEDYQNTNHENTTIEVPIVNGNKTEYLSNQNPSIEGANLNTYVSNDGLTWTLSSQTAGNRYVKTEVTITDPALKVGKVQVNAKATEATQEEGKEEEDDKEEWITYKTEYYECDAGKTGVWLGIETDEELSEGTRLVYTFAKSDDETSWTNYSNNISDNGNSRYLNVKVEYQKKTQETKEEAKLNDLLINYRVDGQDYQKNLIKTNETKLNSSTIMKNPQTYYGVTVTGYECDQNDACTWLLFYADEDNIYLIAKDYLQNKYLPKGRGGVLPNTYGTYGAYFYNINWGTQYGGSSDVLGNKNISRWFSQYSKTGFSSDSFGWKAVAYLVDTDVWAGFKGEFAQWAIGAPPLELLIASYNR